MIPSRGECARWADTAIAGLCRGYRLFDEHAHWVDYHEWAASVTREDHDAFFIALREDARRQQQS